VTPHGLSCRRSSRSACGSSWPRDGCAVAEALATIAFLVAVLISLGVVAAFASRAEQRERRSRDTDYDL